MSLLWVSDGSGDLASALAHAAKLARQYYRRASVNVLRNPETNCIEVHVTSEEN